MFFISTKVLSFSIIPGTNYSLVLAMLHQSFRGRIFLHTRNRNNYGRGLLLMSTHVSTCHMTKPGLTVLLAAWLFNSFYHHNYIGRVSSPQWPGGGGVGRESRAFVSTLAPPAPTLLSSFIILCPNSSALIDHQLKPCVAATVQAGYTLHTCMQMVAHAVLTVDFQLVVQKSRRESAHARTWAGILNRNFAHA